MTFELTMLLWVALTLIGLLAIQGSLTPINQGFAWGLGARDEPREMTAFQGRMKRIVNNHVEGMVIFAVLVLIAHLAGISTTLTQIGAGLYLASRVLFALVYMSGLPVIRTVVWTVGTVGLFMIAFEILTAGVTA